MVGDKYMVNDASIVQPNMMATNGVVQVIDGVMLPTFAPPKNLKVKGVTVKVGSWSRLALPDLGTVRRQFYQHNHRGLRAPVP